MQNIIILLIIGLAAGMVSGSLGVGGGVVIVPALIFFYGMTQQEAQGTSLGLLALPVVIAGAYNYYKGGYINIKFVLILAIAFVVGSYFGSMLAVNISGKTLQKIFAGFMILVALKMLIK
jgi:uncharacterized membrane protein YfcA